MDIKEILRQFSLTSGVAGNEKSAAELGANLLSEYGRVKFNPLGSVICEVKPRIEGKPHIMLDAHIDEIGLIVTFITEDGFLKVGNVGGVDRRTLLASPVTVHTKSGEIKGVICSVPPHLAGDDAKKIPKIDEINIDIGFSTREEAQKYVRVGDRITITACFGEMLGGYVYGKALDDRACCAIILRTLELLKGRELDCGLTAVFSTQEETGQAGAKTAAYEINPTHAIALDVSFAYTPDAEKSKCGELKKGGMIGIAPILSNALTERLIDTAKEKKIPYQLEVMGGRTGTNADDIATTRCGVEVGMISLPLRYMHTPVEMIALEDIEHCARLLAEYLLEVGIC